MGDFFKIVYDYVFILQLITASVSLIIIFYPFKRDIKNIAIGLGHLVALFGGGTLLNASIFALSQVWHAFGGINFQLSWLITVAVYLVICRVYPTSKLIMVATLFTVIISIVDLGKQAMYAMPQGMEAGWICIIFYLFIIASSVVIKHFSLRSYSDVPKIPVAVVLINSIAFLTLIIAHTEIGMNSGTFGTDVFYALVLTAIYIISVSTYLMLYSHCKARKELTVLQVENKLLEADKQMLILSEQAIEEMRQLRHDIKNQYTVMSLMISDGKYDELKAYFDSMNGGELTSYGGNTLIDCGNSLINSIINMEMLKANGYGIQLVTKINVPKELPFDKSDLCRVIVNLIDNAMEGIMRTHDKDYIVDCKIAHRGDYLYISVQNEVDDADNKRILTMNSAKEDSANHGFGHRIVKRITEKYNGSANYTVENGEFIAEVMLDLKNTDGGVLKNG